MSRAARAWSWLRARIHTREAELRLSVRVTVAALATYALSEFLHVPQVLWTVLTAVLVTQLSVGRSVKAAIDYFIGTLGGAIYSGAVAAVTPHSSEVGVFVVLAVAIAPLAFLATINPSFRVAPFTAVMVLLAPAITHVGSVESAFYRILEVALGGMTALVVSFLVLPARAHGLAIDAAARMLDFAAWALPKLLAGFTERLEASSIRAIQVSLSQAFAQLNEVGEEARRERLTYLADQPDLSPLLRIVLRLRHDLIMIGRGASAPLPEPFQARLAAPLARVGNAAAEYLRASAAALIAREEAAPLAGFDSAIDSYEDAIASLRRERLTKDLPSEAVEHIFGLGFALDQLRQNLAELEQCVTDCARASGERQRL
ncbi:FUSC family protein [Methylocapsa aurea]|uniref:FUSC family protein n=1 Tax=Methylocapsa aurea TaxID=663610 RepID=UPI00055BC9D2|nr:FUSC family protein [Methylocapsa aurea]